MELTKKFPITLFLAALGLALVVAGSVAMIVISLIKPPAPTSLTAPSQSGPDLTVLSSPVLNQLSEYDANAVYPVPIGPGDLARDNPFAGY